MKTKKFILRDSTAGNEIEDYNSLEEAQKCIELFEIQDKKDNFYEIYDTVSMFLTSKGFMIRKRRK